jgi:hypothetical protein
MYELEKRLAEVDVIGAEIRSSVERLVALILDRDPVSSQAIMAVEELDQVVGRSVAAALLQSEDPVWRRRLLWLLEVLEPRRDYETYEPVAEVADTDWDDEVRAHARQILQDVNWEKLREEWFLSARKTSA